MPTKPPSKRTFRTKGTGGLYQRASDGMWCAAVELPSTEPGKRRRKVIVRAKKADALAELRKTLKELEKRGNLTTSSPTIAQWCDIWWERYGLKRLKVSTRPAYRSKIDIYIKPCLGRYRLDQLSVEHIERLALYVTETCGKTGATAMSTHRVLSSILSDAERVGKIGHNPARIANKPKVARPKRDFLDGGEARTLLTSAAADPRELTSWATAFLTGVRQAERLGLTRDLIDFQRRELTIAWQLRRLVFEHGCGDAAPGSWPCGRKRGGNCPQRHLDVPGDQEVIPVDGGLYLTRPKSEAGWRTIPMVGVLAELLEEYVTQYQPGANGLVFTRTGGRPIDPSDDNDAWYAALDRAGLRKVKGHSARHSCNTILMELGVPVDVRRQILGHGSNAVNENVYTHTSDVRVAAAMLELGTALDWRTQP